MAGLLDDCLYEVVAAPPGRANANINPRMPEYIYVLVDPRTDAIRYVGRTNNPTVRRNGHKNLDTWTRSRRDEWMRELHAFGLTPRMFIVDETYRQYAEESEQWYIEYYTERGADLTNDASKSVKWCRAASYSALRRK